MRKLGVLFASGIAVGSMVLASPAAWANDYRHQDGHGRYDRGHFTLGVKIVDSNADDRGRRGPSRGDRWSVAFNLVDWRNRVGDGVADCVVTSIHDRDWRTSKSHCDVVFHLPDGNLHMDGTVDGDDFDDGHATLPVTGGSGDFRGAHGKTVFRPAGGWYHHDRGRGRDLTADVDPY
ncbi:MAG TPA: hypothetical protein VKX24_01590 [Acidimicrobiia bacterium]|nr:hypothetical protein [Acidimicrobiia bacterium]